MIHDSQARNGWLNNKCNCYNKNQTNLAFLSQNFPLGSPIVGLFRVMLSLICPEPSIPAGVCSAETFFGMLDDSSQLVQDIATKAVKAGNVISKRTDKKRESGSSGGPSKPIHHVLFEETSFVGMGNHTFHFLGTIHGVSSVFTLFALTLKPTVLVVFFWFNKVKKSSNHQFCWHCMFLVL